MENLNIGAVEVVCSFWLQAGTVTMPAQVMQRLKAQSAASDNGPHRRVVWFHLMADIFPSGLPHFSCLSTLFTSEQHKRRGHRVINTSDSSLLIAPTLKQTVQLNH